MSLFAGEIFAPPNAATYDDVGNSKNWYTLSPDCEKRRVMEKWIKSNTINRFIDMNKSLKCSKIHKFVKTDRDKSVFGTNKKVF